jgi:serine O-acetyltransferase
VGKGLRLPHGAVGLVVHQDTVINDNVTLYQNVTLGRSDTYLSSALSSPGGNIIIGDDVIIGAGAVVLFRSGCTLEIGKGSVVGANSVVIGNIPQGEIWAGNPAKFIRTRPLN